MCVKMCDSKIHFWIHTRHNVMSTQFAQNIFCRLEELGKFDIVYAETLRAAVSLWYYCHHVLLRTRVSRVDIWFCLYNIIFTRFFSLEWRWEKEGDRGWGDICIVVSHAIRVMLYFTWSYITRAWYFFYVFFVNFDSYHWTNSLRVS